MSAVGSKRIMFFITLRLILARTLFANNWWVDVDAKAPSLGKDNRGAYTSYGWDTGLLSPHRSPAGLAHFTTTKRISVTR